MWKPCAAVALLVLLAPGHQAAEPPPSPTAEFPEGEYRLALLVQRGVVAGEAARLAAVAPDSLDTLRLLARASQPDHLLTSLRSIVDNHPARIPDALEIAMYTAAWRLTVPGGSLKDHERTETFRAILRDVRSRLPELSREAAARIERQLIAFDVHDASEHRHVLWKERLTTFAAEYSGTEAARLALVALAAEAVFSDRNLERLEAMVRRFPGTTVAARALHAQGEYWSGGHSIGRQREEDPLPRFERVLTIVAELQSGRYPASEWVVRAPGLVAGFYVPADASLPPATVERMLQGYEAFLRGALARPLVIENVRDSEIGYVIGSRLTRLYERRGERVAGVERLLNDLERTAMDPAAVRYLRALFYMGRLSGAAEHGEAPAEKGLQEMVGLAADGHGFYNRKALATLANLELRRGAYTVARETYQRYADLYPDSLWAWAAALRVGLCDEARGHHTAAAAAYLDAAHRYPDMPLARVLGHAYAARAFEAQADFAQALLHHRLALESWDDRFGPVYSTYAPAPARRSARPAAGPVRDPGEVRREALRLRIAELEKALAMPGGVLLERGRNLLARGRHQQAIDILRSVTTSHPRTPAAADAVSLERTARLERALQFVDVDGDTLNQAAILELEALAREPVDFAVTAARIARATLFWRDGHAVAAARWLDEALAGWHGQQRPAKPADDLEADVAAIRRAVFLPQVGRLYQEDGWDGFPWPSSSPFLLVNSDVRVLLPDGTDRQVTVRQPLPAAGHVLYFDSEQLARLEQILALAGSPHDPGSLQEIWAGFFPGNPKRWTGWQTYPIIDAIEFPDQARTRASARVRIAHTGGSVELEKEGGRWVPKRITGRWIS